VPRRSSTNSSTEAPTEFATASQASAPIPVVVVGSTSPGPVSAASGPTTAAATISCTAVPVRRSIVAPMRFW
jgi:hypothetical protein